MSRRNTIMVQRTYYQIGMVTLFTTLLWLSISLYRTFLSATDVGVEATLLTPVTPTIDQATLASISARTQLSATSLDLVKDLAPATGSASLSILPVTPTPPPSATASSTDVSINEVTEASAAASQ